MPRLQQCTQPWLKPKPRWPLRRPRLCSGRTTCCQQHPLLITRQPLWVPCSRRRTLRVGSSRTLSRKFRRRRKHKRSVVRSRRRLTALPAVGTARDANSVLHRCKSNLLSPANWTAARAQRNPRRTIRLNHHRSRRCLRNRQHLARPAQQTADPSARPALRRWQRQAVHSQPDVRNQLRSGLRLQMHVFQHIMEQHCRRRHKLRTMPDELSCWHPSLGFEALAACVTALRSALSWALGSRLCGTRCALRLVENMR